MEAEDPRSFLDVAAGDTAWQLPATRAQRSSCAAAPRQGSSWCDSTTAPGFAGWATATSTSIAESHVFGDSLGEDASYGVGTVEGGCGFPSRLSSEHLPSNTPLQPLTKQLHEEAVVNARAMWGQASKACATISVGSRRFPKRKKGSDEHRCRNVGKEDSQYVGVKAWMEVPHEGREYHDELYNSGLQRQSSSNQQTAGRGAVEGGTRSSRIKARSSRKKCVGLQDDEINNVHEHSTEQEGLPRTYVQLRGNFGSREHADYQDQFCPTSPSDDWEKMHVPIERTTYCGVVRGDAPRSPPTYVEEAELKDYELEDCADFEEQVNEETEIENQAWASKGGGLEGAMGVGIMQFFGPAYTSDTACAGTGHIRKLQAVSGKSTQGRGRWQGGKKRKWSGACKAASESAARGSKNLPSFSTVSSAGSRTKSLSGQKNNATKAKVGSRVVGLSSGVVGNRTQAVALNSIMQHCRFVKQS